ncbi:MAG: crotonyl-CoA carboxylase/reductase [Gaiellaceae bacterium]
MNAQLDAIVAAIANGASTSDMLELEVPDSYRGLVVRKEDADALAETPVDERDPAQTLHVDEVPVPELAHDEALIAVMGSAINFNTVWSALFSPVPTFDALRRNGRRSALWKRHDLPYHVLGSDAAGVVLRTGPGVSAWKPGDHVVVHGAYVDLESPGGHDDAMLDPGVCAWGYETNFGGLGELAVARASQLLPKPEHLTWEEAACNGVSSSTVYRQLVSQNGAGMKQGDVVLVWGAGSGIGSYAVQYALNGGAYPVAVVSSPERAELVRDAGCECVIDRRAEDFRFFDGERMDTAELRRFRKRVRELTGGRDPNIAFEHTGRDTFAASVYVIARGGCVVTCASTTGYEHTYDNRYLWLGLKRIIGSHISNLDEAARANQLVCDGAIHPALWRTYALDEAHEAVSLMHRNEHRGKVGILCMAGEEDLGVRDQDLRAKHLHAITRWRDRGATEAGDELERQPLPDRSFERLEQVPDAHS